MLHTPTSSTSTLCDFNRNLWSHLPNQSLLDEEEPAWVVDVALKALQDSNIEPVEWGAPLYRRMGVPIVVVDFFYLIRDDDLANASEILSNIGLPLSPPSRLLMKTEGDIAAKGIYHRISRSTLPSSICHIALFPLSFSTILPSELERLPPMHVVPSSRCPTILVPRPSSIYASLIRMMTRYPQHCATRVVLASDLSELIGYHLLELKGGFVDPEDSELWDKLDIDGRIQKAVARVRRWSWDHEWRKDEGWIGDALAWVVEGTADINNLPFAS